MTSTQIRQSFLDFFKSKQHTIVPSSSLMPDSPNLLFTNAGMNQFVPIFLGQKKADVSKWAGAIPGSDTRAVDTQKCIRTGGKHNDLEDVGVDTYHHTFFEMLGNWSFGDYFKKEAIDWAWELLTKVWKFPKDRLYVTVYKPERADDPKVFIEPGYTFTFSAEVKDNSEFSFGFDVGAYDYWAELLSREGLDPKTHIVFGAKKDNFWMMGDTGPCGPCSEIHVDLTPEDRTLEMEQRGSTLVNKGDARCIEIWNLVFIQFNANPGGSVGILPACHVDTGMGFERVTSIIQGTKGFTDFKNAKISNYETDIFSPIFNELEKLSERHYGHTIPTTIFNAHLVPKGVEELRDVAFRVIADHIRTLSFAIADGIQPGNTDRNYVLRRILRRAVRYGRTLGFHEPFFYKLVDVLADTMGDVFPEIRAKRNHVEEVIRTEEVSFNQTLDRGIRLFEEAIDRMSTGLALDKLVAEAGYQFKPSERTLLTIPGAVAFELYDTYGFPIDLTELMARERGLTVDTAGFEKLMEEQRARARAAQKKEVITVSSEREIRWNVEAKTKFVGYENLETQAKVLEVVSLKEKIAVILDTSACYAEMGGQVGDTGELSHGGQLWRIVNTHKSASTWLHFIEGEHTRPRVSQLAPSPTVSGRAEDAVGGAPTAAREGARAPQSSSEHDLPIVGSEILLTVDRDRREAIQRHHTVTHLLHWALHEIVSKEASQKGSFVGPDKLTFDFNSAPLTPQQIADIEKLVNERILENAGVSWIEVPYGEVKSRKDVMQFFGDKYGDTVRVVQIGGRAGELNGYSMELCGGTHTRATGEIGLFRILGEGAIAAGVRRIEAIAGLEAYRKATDELSLIKSLAGKVNTPVGELEKKIESMLAHQKQLEKQVKSAMQRNASNAASELLGRAQTVNGIPLITCNLGDADGDFLQTIADALKGRFKGVVVLGGYSNNAVTLIATVSPDFTARVQAGKIIQQIAPIVGGKGGGKPDNARGGGKDASKLDEALAKVKTLLS